MSAAVMKSRNNIRYEYNHERGRKINSTVLTEQYLYYNCVICNTQYIQTVTMVTVVRADAAASIFHIFCYILVLICYLFAFITEAHIAYDRKASVSEKEVRVLD